MAITCKEVLASLSNGVVLLLSLLGLSSVIALYQLLYVKYYWLIENPTIVPLKVVIGICSGASLLAATFFIFGLSHYNDNDSNANEYEVDETKYGKRGKGEISSCRKTLYNFLLWTSILSNGVAIGYICYQVNNMDKIFDGAFQHGMKLYKEDVNVKATLDLIQIRYQCCGDLSYRDWLEFSWFPELEYTAAQKRLGVESVPSVPFSCCNSSVLRPCIHTNPEEDNDEINYSFWSDFTLYKEGCNKVFQSYYLQILQYSLCAVSCSLFLQVFILLLVCCGN